MRVLSARECWWWGLCLLLLSSLLGFADADVYRRYVLLVLVFVARQRYGLFGGQKACVMYAMSRLSKPTVMPLLRRIPRKFGMAYMYVL